MRTEKLNSALLSTLVIASMMLPAILLLSAVPASGKPDQVIIYPVADIEGGSFMMISPQLKFDISSIPSGAKIISAKLWLYVFYMMGGRSYYIMRVEDQDWDETITPIEFNSQAVTDVESFFSLYEGWGYVSVENQLIVDHSAGRTYASFRLSPVDSGWSTEGIVDRHVLCLAMGISEMNCYSSEYDGYDPYLEVNYYLPVEFELENLYKVSLDVNLYLENGSKLVVKFYTWGSIYQAESVFENVAPPENIVKFDNIPHPQGRAVENARLVLTGENTENIIWTVARFTVNRAILMARLSEIKGRWPFAFPPERGAIIQEISGIKGKWPFAPIAGGNYYFPPP